MSFAQKLREIWVNISSLPHSIRQIVRHSLTRSLSIVQPLR